MRLGVNSPSHASLSIVPKTKTTLCDLFGDCMERQLRVTATVSLQIQVGMALCRLCNIGQFVGIEWMDLL